MLSISKNTLYKILILIICLFGFILRLKTYLIARPLWHDESSLACSIVNRGLFDYFSPLEFIQMAPPFFMMGVELITKFLGEAELALRLLPFLCGVASIFLFYELSTKIFKKPFSILLANFLFAINYNLIYYTQEFKQYSAEVLVILISALIFSKLDLKNLSIKNVLICSFLSVMLIFFSYTSFFVIAGFIASNIFPIKKESIKKALIYIVPIALSGFLYYLLMLSPAKDLVINSCGFYWEEGFVKLNIKSISRVLDLVFSYTFLPNTYSPLVIFAPLAGIYLLIKENTQLNKIILATAGMAVIVSALHLYPIKDRLSLYLVPLIIIFTVKSLDFDFKKRKIIAVIIFISLASNFYHYDLKYLKDFFGKNIFQEFDAKTSLQFIAKHYKPTEIFVYNGISDSDYEYYKNYFNFEPTKTIKLDPERKPESDYIKKLEKLERNKTYWFYYPHDSIIRKQESAYVKDWLKSKNIEYKEYKYVRSRVIHTHL